MKGRLAVLVAAACCVCGGAGAEESPVAPLLFDEAFLVARVDLEKLRVEPLYDALDQVRGLAALPSRQWMGKFVEAVRRAGGKELYLVWGGSTGIVFVPLAPSGDAAAIQQALIGGRLSRWLDIETAEQLAGGVAAGRRSLLLYLRKLKAAERPNLAPALAATAGSAVQLVLLPTEANRDAAAGTQWPILPLDATTAVVRQLDWASIGIDGPAESRLKMVFAARDAAGGEKLQAALGAAIEPFLMHPEVRRNLALVENLRAILRWQSAGETVSLELDDREGRLTMVARGMIRPVLEAELAQGALAKSINHFKQIGIALQNHHDVHRRFPAPAILDGHGKPLLSWRVAILPFVNERALYGKFHLNEPWDSPHNIALVDEMPEVYRCPLAKVADGHTVYLTPRGEGTVFEGPDGTQLRHIIDGTSKTIAVVEVDDAHAVPWTSPDDWPYNPDDPTAGLGGHFEGIFLTAGCDAAVHTLQRSIDPEVLRSLISYAGREPVAFPQ
jgi:hypothetical protein